jgi:hypothetical protein
VWRLYSRRNLCFPPTTTTSQKNIDVEACRKRAGKRRFSIIVAL